MQTGGAAGEGSKGERFLPAYCCLTDLQSASQHRAGRERHIRISGHSLPAWHCLRPAHGAVSPSSHAPPGTCRAQFWAELMHGTNNQFQFTPGLAFHASYPLSPTMRARNVLNCNLVSVPSLPGLGPEICTDCFLGLPPVPALTGFASLLELG